MYLAIDPIHAVALLLLGDCGLRQAELDDGRQTRPTPMPTPEPAPDRLAGFRHVVPFPQWNGS